MGNSDLDITFDKAIVNGDLLLINNNDSIKQAIVNLLKTNNYERPFRSDIGAGLNRLLFELNNESLLSIVLTQHISNVINNYEPRVNINNISIKTSKYSVHIDIYYTIISNSITDDVSIKFNKNGN